MDPRGKIAIVTGAASGIGRALSRALVSAGARVVVSDRDAAGLEVVANELGATAIVTDVAREAEVEALVGRVIETEGRVDLFCGNAGIFVPGGVEAAEADFRRSLDVNFLAHVHAARALLPGWLARGEGYYLATVSAAGLLSQIGSAPYAVSKHAALAFVEWLALTHGDQGIRVSALCPQGVLTGMLSPGEGPAFLLEGALEADAVAAIALDGLRAERFLILPHPEVAEYVARKSADPDRWIRGMQKLRRRIEGAG